MAERSVRRSLLHDQGKLESDDECSSHQYYREPSSQSSSPVTFMVVFSTFISISGSYIYGSVAGYTSPVESEIISDLDLSLAEYSVFGSMLTIGGIFGATFSGKLADLAGRRGAMWISDSFCIIGWVAIVLSEDAWSLDLGRLLLGFGIGLITYLAPVYVAEITPKNLRGAFTSINNFMMGFGVSVAYLIGSIVSWRLLALISIFPCLVQFLGLFFIPESPRWLGMKGRDEQLEASLQSLRGKNADISQEAADIKVYVENHEQGSQGRFLELFQCRYAYSITVGVGLMVLQQFGGITAYIYYTSYVLEIAGFSSNVGTIIVSICQFVLNLAGVLLIGRFGRRPLLMVSAAGMCLGSFITGLSFLLEDYNSSKEIIQVLALGGILVYLAFISFGLGPLPWVIFSEIVPINIKGSAGSLANFVYWSGAWIISYTFNFLFEWSSSGVFFVYAIISCLGIIFVGKMVPETKGRTLEEIQASVTQQHI